jgi:hypothetical protein
MRFPGCSYPYDAMLNRHMQNPNLTAIIGGGSPPREGACYWRGVRTPSDAAGARESDARRPEHVP